ncbi:cAMP-dependent protein kinase type II-alpha regulatory subunit, partial [Fasciola gigantica]
IYQDYHFNQLPPDVNPGPSAPPNAEEVKETEDSFMATQSDTVSQPANYTRRGGVAAESWDPENEEPHEKVVYPKTDEQKASLTESIKNILLFRCLDEDDRTEVVDAMFERKVSPGEDVITYGEPGDNFYIIESGTYDIFISADGELKKVAQYEDKGSFGELALMYNTPRAATIRAVTDGTLWAMSRETFRSIVLTKAFKKRKLYESLLESVDLLKDLSAYDRMSLADALHTRIVEAGEPVFLQGEVGQEMYFIESGSVVVKMKGSEENAEEVELCDLVQNDYFGELALITKNPRAASVIAKERTRLAVLEVDSFERILGPCKATLEQKQEEYAERRQQFSTLSQRL